MQIEYWTPEDFVADLCSAEDIGREKPPAVLRDLDAEAALDEGQAEEPRRRGRPPSKEKKLMSVQDSLRRAFHALGGVEGLVQWGRSHPTEFYRLTGRLIPQEIKSQTDAVFTIVHALPPSRLDYHPADAGGTQHITRMLPHDAQFEDAE